MDLIDTHVHLLHADLFTYDWCAGNVALAGNHTLDDYRVAVKTGPAGVKVSSLIFMEASVPPDQTELEAELFSRLANRARGTPAITAVIAGCRPESPGFPEQLATLALDARVRGLRRVLYTQPDEFLQSPLLAENLRRLSETGLTFDLCVRPKQLVLVADLIEACPQTQFVLDHAGAPDVKGGELELWQAGIRLVAARPNVACKFSGLGSLADPNQPLTAQVRRYFTHCLECFFPERMLWGSDWPVSADLAAWLDTTAELLGELQDFEQAAIGTGNANRIYRLN
ncbi:MAG: amidohydrolase family protein [Cephaloticoccus sp.]|nr:amidohydrolase family protein [Cephaloticoccus sp.]MCF7759562.1 amidohydrolase family protein [Cephaloticoccus sp.]